MRVKSLAVLFVLSSLMSGCTSYSQEEREFLRRVEGNRQVILEYPPDRQVVLYVAAMMYFEPPDLGLADVVSQSGAALLPGLYRQLQNEDREGAKVDLLFLAERMNDLSFYDFEHDQDALVLFDRVASGLQNPAYRRMALSSLANIRDGIRGKVPVEP